MIKNLIKWHPGFYGCLELELKKYNEQLLFNPEFILSKEPLRIDMIVIEKVSNVRIDNQICQIFRKYNIIEYKSPTDGMTIDNYYKTVGYAYLYKALGKEVDEIPHTELTVTLVRDKYPYMLIDTIIKYGGSVDNKYPGIYYVSGLINIPSQIVVQNELDGVLHAALKILSNDAKKEDLKCFLANPKYYEPPGDRINANAVLQVCAKANTNLFDEIRREKDMCQALMEIMHEEVQQECDIATTEKSKKYIKNLMRSMNLTEEQAMDALMIPEDERSSYRINS